MQLGQQAGQLVLVLVLVLVLGQELLHVVLVLVLVVAGVQLLLRQHRSPAPFFQASSPLPFHQLSTVCAPAAVTSAAEASNKATLLSLFMVVL